VSGGDTTRKVPTLSDLHFKDYNPPAHFVRSRRSWDTQSGGGYRYIRDATRSSSKAPTWPLLTTEATRSSRKQPNTTLLTSQKSKKMATKGSKKAMMVKAEPLGDTSPIARKHTPPQGKGKKVAVKTTKGKELDIIGTSGHAPLPGRQPRQVKSKFARNRESQQATVAELREISKRMSANPPKIAVAPELFEHQSLVNDNYVPEDESVDEQPPSPQQIDEPVKKEVRPTVGRLALPKTVRRRATTPTPAVPPQMPAGSSSPGLFHEESPEQRALESPEPILEDEDTVGDQSAYLLRAE